MNGFATNRVAGLISLCLKVDSVKPKLIFSDYAINAAVSRSSKLISCI